MEEVLGGFYMFAVLFVFVLAILWFLLPFAIFGTKDKLSELINAVEETNKEANKTNKELASLRVIVSKLIDPESNESKSDMPVEEIENMTLATKYASYKGVEYSSVLEGLREGKILGRLINGEWYVSDEQWGS